MYGNHSWLSTLIIVFHHHQAHEIWLRTVAAAWLLVCINHFWTWMQIIVFHDHRQADMHAHKCCSIVSGLCQLLLNVHCDCSFPWPQGYQMWSQTAAAELLPVYANYIWMCIPITVFHDHLAPDMVTYSYYLIISGICQLFPNMHGDQSLPRLRGHQIW